MKRLVVVVLSVLWPSAAVARGDDRVLDWTKVTVGVSLRGPGFARFGDGNEAGRSWARFLQSDEGKMYARADVKPAADGFTPLHPRTQPSAWVTGLEWGGGIGLMALALALGFVTVRPTPRRRPPDLPAPAWNRRSS